MTCFAFAGNRGYLQTCCWWCFWSARRAVPWRMRLNIKPTHCSSRLAQSVSQQVNWTPAALTSPPIPSCCVAIRANRLRTSGPWNRFTRW